MAKVIEGNLSAAGLKFGIVASRFNEFITSKLVDGAMDALKRHGANMAKVDVAWVPGAFEIPQVCQKMAKSNKYDAVICLGCVIKGDTPHFDYIAAEVSKGDGSRRIAERHTCDLRSTDNGFYRAGGRTRGNKSRQQRF